MRQGVRNAVRVCMRVSAADRVAVIGDRQSGPIARLLVEEACNVGAVAEGLQLESYGQRLIRSLPEAMRATLLSFRPTVTFFTASSQPGEVAFRMGPILFLTHDLNVRHGHMVGITPRIMREGMAVDYHLVSRVTRSVYERVRVPERSTSLHPRARTSLLVSTQPCAGFSLPASIITRESGGICPTEKPTRPLLLWTACWPREW
jgi:Leucyl aminopeptidase (aminopeptidase T)